MKFAFTKRAGKVDELLVTREGGSVEHIVCPKQGMIPHDMVHFAVEKGLLRQGFLSKVGAGEATGFQMDGDDGAETVERLVETMQAEVWSGPVPTDELIQLYESACRARNHPILPVSSRQIERIREEMADLARRWDAVPTNGSLVLHFMTSIVPALHRTRASAVDITPPLS
ncbi:MAG TPA: hypothetical protein VM689_09025 [Aliidongia sp.]|nr:hypothetical protein [Aliidongia sp.]